MDGRDFDDLLRSLTESRRSLLMGALAAAGGLAGLTSVDAKGKKKKKKPCAKKCADGCCTGKFGKCITPDQQSATQCGDGGEICRSDCGVRQTCGSDCANGCCTGAAVCLSGDQQNASQCGSGGEACRNCGDHHDCRNHACCGFLGAECILDQHCCDDVCQDFRCCVANGARCLLSNHCCGNAEQCQNGFCCRQPQQSCTNDTKCCNSLPCTNSRCCKPPSGTCFTDNECCDGSCVLGHCCATRGTACHVDNDCCSGPCTEGRCCQANGGECFVDTDCCEDEDICDNNVCKRKHREFCEDDIVCEDAYPFCVENRCLRCVLPEIETGTDNVCCPPTKSCPAANGGAGACCVNEHCCLPHPSGMCMETEHGTSSC